MAMRGSVDKVGGLGRFGREGDEGKVGEGCSRPGEGREGRQRSHVETETAITARCMAQGRSRGCLHPT